MDRSKNLEQKMAFDVEISGNDRIITPTGEGSKREAVDAVRVYRHMGNLGGEINGWDCVPMFDGWQVVSPNGETFRVRPNSNRMSKVEVVSGTISSRFPYSVGYTARR